MIIRKALVLIILSSCCVFNTHADYSQRDDVKQFINMMVKKHGFNKDELVQRFRKARKLEGVLEAIARPAEKTKTWKEYRPIFLTEKRIKKGVQFIKDNYSLLKKAEKQYGVPPGIIAAIIGVETFYGKRKGRTNVFDSLTTLGFDYPPRASFFRSELEQFLLLSREEDVDANTVTGSYAGAMGMPQFISSSYRSYAVDFDGDGKRDLWNSRADVIGSVANYFNRHGWIKGGEIIHRAGANDSLWGENKLKPHTAIKKYIDNGVSVKAKLPGNDKASLLKFNGRYGVEYWLALNNFYVITRYNHSALYALAVYQLSLELAEKSLML